MSRKTFDELVLKPLPTKVQASELDRITHFYRLVLVMKVDEIYHENEYVTLKNFGLKLGIRPGIVDQILHLSRSKNSPILSPEELISLFNAYYN